MTIHYDAQGVGDGIEPPTDLNAAAASQNVGLGALAPPSAEEQLRINHEWKRREALRMALQLRGPLTDYEDVILCARALFDYIENG